MAARAANGIGRTGVWLSIATSVFLMLGALGSVFYIGFKVQATADTQEARGRRIAAIEERDALMQDRLTKTEVAQNEIETQFCSSDIVRNLMHANDQRTQSMLWEKVFGMRIPTDNSYYPTICNWKAK